MFLHHVEMCVGNESHVLNLLKNGFGFLETHHRCSRHFDQWVLRSGHSVFVVTMRKYVNNCKDGHKKQKCICSQRTEDNCLNYPVFTCCCNKNRHSRDAVFNIALRVDSVNNVMKNIKSEGSHIIKDVSTISDDQGDVLMAVVESKCSNVIHTLLDKSRYSGDFLPGFARSCFKDTITDYADPCIQNLTSELPTYLTQYMDHVTYVCEVGQSAEIIRWYEKCFGMKRFLTNKEETEEGFVLGDKIGIRLKALQYWRCTETGITSPKQTKDEDILRIVLAEPLLNSESSHVATFLKENLGPGVQHIGLHTSSILRSVQELLSRHIRFRKPPPTYYEDSQIMRNIEVLGLNLQIKELCECGILVDAEHDEIDQKRYLMQIFTHPVFDCDTFFLEVIQRHGATGFGSGNIAALARSIVRYQEEQRNHLSVSSEIGHG